MKRLMGSEWLPLLVLVLVLVLAAPLWAQEPGGAPGAESPFAVFLAWLNGPLVKTALLLVSGFVLKQWPQVVNKAIPLLLGVASTLVSVVHLLFPEQALAPTAALMPASTYFAAAVAHGGGWGSFFSGTFVPLVLAVGINSGQKNVAEWFKIGAAVWDRTGNSGRHL